MSERGVLERIPNFDIDVELIRAGRETRSTRQQARADIRHEFYALAAQLQAVTEERDAYRDIARRAVGKAAQARRERDAERESLAELREQLRVKMLDVPTTDGNDTFHDGYHNGLLTAIGGLDTYFAKFGADHD